MGLTNAARTGRRQQDSYRPLDNDYADGRYARMSEFRIVKNELLSIKLAQEKLAESVFSNLDYFSTAEEKRDIILTLQAELEQEARVHQSKKQFLSNKIAEETARLQNEIALLIGSKHQQGNLIASLVNDLAEVHEGHASALKILGNRYELKDGDLDMQRELLDFVNSIERAERTYHCLTTLLAIANEIQSTEERIELLLSQVAKAPDMRVHENLVSIFTQVVERLKNALAHVREWRDAQTACLNQAGFCAA